MAKTSFVHPESLIATDSLERQLGDPDLRILDCTTHLIPDPKITYQVVPGRADFEKGHIPGAQFVASTTDTMQTLAVADFNGDGALDVAVVPSNATSGTIWLNGCP